MTDILFFAAGLGTRMLPLTKDLPKPLIPIGDQTLFDHAWTLADIPAIGRKAVNVHYKAPQMRQYLAGKTVSISDETDLLRDTGGGLRHALPLLDSDPVMTLNTDAIWSGPNPVSMMLDAWQDHMTCLLMLVPRAQTLGHRGQGDFEIQPDGRLLRKRDAIYGGLQLIRPQALAGMTDNVFSMNAVWDTAQDQRGLFGVMYPGRWCDVGQPESIPLAETLLNETARV